MVGSTTLTPLSSQVWMRIGHIPGCQVIAFVKFAWIDASSSNVVFVMFIEHPGPILVWAPLPTVRHQDVASGNIEPIATNFTIRVYYFWREVFGSSRFGGQFFEFLLRNLHVHNKLLQQEVIIVAFIVGFIVIAFGRISSLHEDVAIASSSRPILLAFTSTTGIIIFLNDRYDVIRIVVLITALHHDGVELRPTRPVPSMRLLLQRRRRSRI
mmetsp:Transcript_120351/g.179785  ORF Transcript_120351/g.179785 Transcript_120351/m.179785 type:complete len:212 (+) Transcript_120351:172-807(+)